MSPVIPVYRLEIGVANVKIFEVRLRGS
jgi:hypothetical protein